MSGDPNAAVGEFHEDVEQFDNIEAEAHPECIEWMIDRIMGLLHIENTFTDDEKIILTDFLVGDEKKRTMFAYLTSVSEEETKLQLMIGYPHLQQRHTRPGMNLDLLYFVRVDPKREITPEDIDKLVHYGNVKDGQCMDAFLRTMQHVLTPTLLRNTTWPDGIQKEFRNVIHRFMAQLTEDANRLKGKTVLYVPLESMDEEKLKAASQDKELVQRFETAVIHWTRQIREVVNEKDVEAASESGGPLAEIEYWRARTRDLNNIRKQFTRHDVLQIVDVLNRAKSTYYLEPFLNHKTDIENGTEEAIDNLKYLKTLEEPCRRLAVADPKEIPLLIKDILRTVQMIFIHSKHYKKDRFYRLLRMISNEIVQRCRQKINLQSIFDGDVEKPMLALQESVEAGEAWIAACRKMLSATAKRYRSEKAEQLEIDESIFSEIDGFVKHRCMNLQEVCKGQLQFGFRVLPPTSEEEEEELSEAEQVKHFFGALPCFGGTKGDEIENQLLDIQKTFKAKMEGLRRLSYDILDVKAQTWMDDFRQLKADLDNLGTMMTQVIEGAFEVVATIEGGVELLEAFHYLAKREELERAVDRRKNGVWKLFQKEVGFVQKELQKYSAGKIPPILFLHPPSAGHSFWFRTFRQRVEASFRLLYRCYYLEGSTEKNEALSQYSKLSLEESVKKQYGAWKGALPEHPSMYLENNLIARRERENDVTTFLVNFAPELTILFEEARYWGRLGEAVPPRVAEMCQREERLRIFRENVSLAVRAYNTIVLSLSPDERRLFACRIAYLDSKFASGMTKLTWSSQDTVVYFFMVCRKTTSEVQADVKKFKLGVQEIFHLCKVISETVVVSIEKKNTYEVEAFDKRQQLHRESISKKLAQIHEMIVNTMRSLFEIFQADYATDPKIRVEWHKFVETIDKEMEDAFKLMVKKSWQEIERALGTSKDDDKTNDAPLFQLKVKAEKVNPGDTKPTPIAEGLTSLSTKMVSIAKEVIAVVCVIPRLEEALSTAVDGVTDQELTEKSLPRVQHKSPFVDAQYQGPYYDQGESESMLFMKQIQSAFAAIGEKIRDQLLHKMQNSETKGDSMWATKEMQINRAKANWKLDDYKVNIDMYNNLERQISQWDTTVDCLFVRLDYRPLKAHLQKQCRYWVEVYLDVLNSIALQELDAFYKDWENTLSELRKRPRSLDHLGEQLRLASDTTDKLPITDAKFEPLQGKYKRLEDFKKTIPDEERKRVRELRQHFEDFKVNLTDVKKELDVFREQFKQDLETDSRAFNSACEQLRRDLVDSGPYSSGLTTNEAFIKIADYKSKLNQRREKESELRAGMSVFGITKDPQKDLKEVQTELEHLTRMWEQVDKWQRDSGAWKTQEFRSIDKDEVAWSVDTHRKDVLKMRKEMERRDVWIKLKEDIELFKRVLPVLDDLLIEAIKGRHWEQLKLQLDGDFDYESPEFCMNDLVALRVDKHAEFVSNLSTAARQELKIDRDLDKITETWDTTDLKVEPYRSTYFKIASIEDITNTLTEHITLLSTMKMSRFVEKFKFRVQEWEQKLSTITDTLEGLLLVQTKWMYLENIFIGSEDIKRKLVEESKLFDHVHMQWLSIMKNLHDEPNVKKALTKKEKMLKDLNDMANDLETIQKSLEGFLKSRRRVFPRFYFLSNDDLLEILGHSKEPTKVQPHLRKCFEGVFRLDFVEQKKGQIVAKAMSSADGERVPFTSPVIISDVQVEKWLGDVEARMRETVSRTLLTTLNDLQSAVYDPRKRLNRDALRKWVITHEGQCLITASSINWTKEVERVITEYQAIGMTLRRKKTPIYKLYKRWKIMIKRYCEIVRTKLDKLERNKLVSLITIEVHARDILRVVQAQKINDLRDFEWTKQLRFYREHDEKVVIKQTSATVKYDYEYLGNSGRLVITSLTDRAYMTLTTALQLQRGGLPQGPAGTGKTETVKDLGKAIGKYVMVFNCSDGLDFQSLGRMFSGLAQTGAWSCFDEFNRIEVEVLSVVAQQIFSVLSAVGERKTEFLFEGDTIPLNLNCGIFVTMNPGYAGRSELPDNLKALLRPVSMMVPDFTLICEITLLSQGFTEATSLALKVAILYELMEKQLSKQDHYDFSLRNVKAVLVQAGNLKRLNFPGTEQQLCLKAMADMNMPKFVKADVPLFQGMLQDLFPGVEPEDAGLDTLRSAAKADLASRQLQVSEHIVLKVLHLWDTLNTRHGVMVVGGTGSGKTVTWQTLANSGKRLKEEGVEGYEPVRVNIVNPKSVTMDELYGSYNLATREWHDGILSDIMRTICRDESLMLKWLLFDGPVDTLWIESMNTVLDDNKMLTLNSGERINMTPQISMVFEVADLSQASPATVSRCGMVYFNVEDLGWRPFVTRWLASRKTFEIAINAPKPEATVAELQVFFDQHLGRVLDFRDRECTELFPTTAIGTVRGFTNLFDAVANPDAVPFIPSGSSYSTHAGEQYLPHIRMCTLLCLAWSVGGSLTEDSRRKFDLILRDIAQAMDCNLPSSETAFDFYPCFRTHTWRPWDDHADIQRPFHPPEDTPYYKMIVPTMDTVRYSAIVNMLLRNKVHTVLVGNTGTGKSLVANSVTRTLSIEQFMTTQLNFSAQTTAKNVQDIIEGRMEHKSKKVYSPPGGRRMVCLVEDLNMPSKEKFGAQPPLELLRTWIDSGCWYDRSTQARRQVNEMQLMCLMTFGRPDITQRLLSKLLVLNITFPTETVISKIFTTLLNHRFQKFPDFLPYIDNIVKVTTQVYNKVTTDLLPIPSKSHYVFNLRDLSKVFGGIYSAYLESIETREQLVVLWMHECFRVFSDRMNHADDKSWFKNLIVEKLAANFQTKWNTLLKDGRNPIFVDFWEGEYDEMAKYKLVPANAELKKKLEEQLEVFNGEPGARPMNLVFFTDAMEHLCRIHRIIRQPRGNALLVGLGGSGRNSLTRLAAFLAGFGVFSIEIHKKYNSERFHEDLRTLYRTCGGPKKQQRVFYFSDNQIVQTSFLEDLNNMLSTGEVPNLFPKDDVQTIKDECEKEAVAAGCKNTVDDVFGFFIQRAVQNLHLVVAFSPAQKSFRIRLRQFPALVSNTSIDWFVEWPNEALKEVSMRFLMDIDVEPPERREALADMFVAMHDSTHHASIRLRETLKRYNYVTPSSYLDLVRGYERLLGLKRDELSEQRDKLKNGLLKLEETKDAVGNMSIRLKQQEEELKVKAAEVDQAVQVISGQKILATEQEALLGTEKGKIEREKQTAEAIAADARSDLEKAMPALDAATQALESLRKEEMQEMKAYIKPPPAVQMVMGAVQVSLKRPTDWSDSKTSLNDPKFLELLKSYPKDEMSDRLLNQLEREIKKPGFEPGMVRKVSIAAGGLCEWVIAIHRYGLVYKEVAPKQAKLAAAAQRVATMEQALRTKQEKLDEVLARVRKLQEDLDANIAAKIALQAEAEATQAKLERAQTIVQGLEGERERWTKSIERYESSITNLVGDTLLASGFLSYSGAFPFEYRQDLLHSWAKEVRRLSIPMTKGFDFVDFLVDATEVRDWQALGLPGDDFSKENAVMVTQGTRWPLMVDPQQQANKWIKRMEKENGLKVIDPKQENFIKTIENAVQFGQPVLLQDILDEIDPSLDSVVSKAIIRKGSRAMIKIGDNLIDYNDKFKLYITTRMANPHYTPETCVKVCLLNFAVKEQGLEEQLLKIVVEREKPELEVENEKLILETAAAKKETKRLEDEILTLLAHSDDTLLDNAKLIETLKVSKKTATDIQKRLKEHEVTSEKIQNAREQFRECARRASILYFVLSDLGAIDTMYQFALDAYIILFQNSIQKSAQKVRVSNIAERVDSLNSWHTDQVYANTCRGLFEKHKLLFSMHMAVRILMGRNESKEYAEEYAYFMKGGQVLDKESQVPNPAVDWITAQSWDNICELDRLLNFHGIAASFEQAHEEWRQWFLAEKPEEALMPSEWQLKTAENYMHRMILVRCLRPDRVVFMVQKYIVDMMGEGDEEKGRRFIEPPAFNLNETFEESSPLLPLVFVLSPGVDPTNQLKGLADKRGRHLTSLALGQGQGTIAANLISTSASNGSWVFLANCHLMVSWLQTLEKIIDDLSTKNPHENFRLWLSSIPTPQFPIGILQKAIKMTTEPPTGLKANMMRLYNYISEDHFNKSGGERPHLYRPLLFALCFFHSVLLERRKFGTLGYNVVYDFNYSDFEVSENIIALYVQQMLEPTAESVPYPTLRYLISDASYGGRVTDDWDRRLINTYIEQFMCPSTVSLEAYKLSAAPEYHIPIEAPPYQSHKDFCARLPLDDPPEAFGQHPNADIASQISNASSLLDNLMSVNATLVRGGGGGQSAAVSVEERCLATMANLEEQVPQPIDYDAVVEAVEEDLSSALCTCLLQEIQRYNVLLNKIHRQREELRRAVKGEIVMNDELDSIFQALLVGRVPPPWTSAYPSSKPLASWARDLGERIDQMIQWGRSPLKVFWLAGFTYPTGFLKALQQQQARTEGYSIDQYVWEFFVLGSEDKTIMHGAKEGAYVRGIYVEGAGWDTQGWLCEPAPMKLIEPMPIIHFRPRRREGKPKLKNSYACPLYMYPVRTGTRERPSYVVTVDLPSGGVEPEHWIKRGTALLLATSE